MFIKPYQEINMDFYPQKKILDNGSYEKIESFESDYINWFTNNMSVLDKYPWLSLSFNQKEKKVLAKILNQVESYNNLNFSLKFKDFFNIWFSIDKNLEKIYIDGVINSYQILMDKLDNDKKYKNEVFIGRDGLYMYYARRSYLLGQGRTDKKVSYLNLSRDLLYYFWRQKEEVFLDYLLSNTKITRNDLEKDDFIFIDTGYEGSVLMSIIDFIKEKEGKKVIDYYWNNCLVLEGYDGEDKYVDSIFTVGADENNYCLLSESLEKPIYKVKNVKQENNKWLLEVTLKEKKEIIKAQINKLLILKHFYNYGKFKKEN